MENDFTLSLQEAMKMLGKSERTVQRYLRQGRLTKQYITTEYGRELRLSKSEVLRLADILSHNGDTPRPGDDATGGRGVFGLDLKEFFKRYESVVAQMGYFRGKLEQQESEIKMLTAGRQELLKGKEQVIAQVKRLSQEKEQVERKVKELQEALEREKRTLSEQEQQYRKRLRRIEIVGLILAFIFLLITFAISPPGQDLIKSWLGQR